LPTHPYILPAQDGNNNNNALGGGGGGLGDFMAWKKGIGYGQSTELMAHGFLSRPTIFIFNA